MFLLLLTKKSLSLSLSLGVVVKSEFDRNHDRAVAYSSNLPVASKHHPTIHFSLF